MSLDEWFMKIYLEWDVIYKAETNLAQGQK